MLFFLWLSLSRWWFQFFLFSPYLGKIPILFNIFQMRWNHQQLLHLDRGIELGIRYKLLGIHVWRLNDGEQQKMLAENSLMRQVLWDLVKMPWVSKCYDVIFCCHWWTQVITWWFCDGSPNLIQFLKWLGFVFRFRKNYTLPSPKWSPSIIRAPYFAMTFS